MHPISFPGLGIGNLNIPQDVVQFGNFRITWYGLLIALGIVLAMIYGMRRTKDFKITMDDLTDVLIFSLIFAIIGARLYYVIFYVPLGVDGMPLSIPNPYFQDPLSIFYIWNGGLAIYGGIIGAFITAFIVCRIKKISVGAIFDIGALGFLIGQAIGRWGNFVNQEAFGRQTTLPWGMKIFDNNMGQYITVHPCFLYESLWCVLGFILLHNYSKKHRKFNGEIFLMYIMWYGVGRFLIEGLRTDSLMIGATIRVSQLVAAILVVAAFLFYIYKRSKVKESLGTVGYSSVYEDAAKALAEQDAEIATRQHIENNPDEDEDEDEIEEDTEDEEEVYLDDEPESDEPVNEKDDDADKKKD